MKIDNQVKSFESLICFEDKHIMILRLNHIEFEKFSDIQHIREIGEELPGYICTNQIATKKTTYLIYTKNLIYTED